MVSRNPKRKRSSGCPDLETESASSAIVTLASQEPQKWKGKKNTESAPSAIVTLTSQKPQKWKRKKKTESAPSAFVTLASQEPQKWKRKQKTESAPSAIVTLASQEPQKWKKKKKKMNKEKKDMNLASDHDRVHTSNTGDLALPAVADSHAAQPNTPHGGLVRRIDSNWKQLQAALRKGQGARGIRNPSKNMKFMEPAKDIAGGAATPKERQSSAICPRNADSSLTSVLAIDCEMVGVGFDGKRSALARVSLVNNWGNVVYDKHVRPMERVTDFRTNISGVRGRDLRKAEEFAVVQKEVAQLIFGRVMVGHGVHNDLKVMYLSHPKKDIRDTSVYLPLRSKIGRPRALRHIADDILGVKIQEGEHCSVQDARAAMYIYEHLKKEWEDSLSRRHKFRGVRL